MSAEMDRQTRIWRRVLIALGTLALAVVVMYLLNPTIGSLGAWEARSGVPYTLRFAVLSSDVNYAYRAGLRTGDTIDVRLLSPEQRYRLLNRKVTGQPLTLPIRRNGRLLHITVVAVKPPMPFSTLLANAGGVWMILFALLLAWKRSDSPEARLLALLLILGPLSNDLSPFAWATPWFPLDVGLNVISALLGFSPVLLAAYTSTFAQPLSAGRRILTWASYAIGALAVGLSLLEIVAAITAVPDPMNVWLWSGLAPGIPVQSFGIAFWTLPLLAGLAAIRPTRGPARTRLVWAMSFLGIYYAYNIANIALTSAISNAAQALLLVTLGNFVGLVLPVGLTYSLFNRRLIDMGFVLNRAAVFSALSIIVVGAFVLLEWALGTWFEHASHEAGLAANAALALLLGLSLRFVHHRVDRFVDTVFFRKRHEDEQALRNFAHEAPYITDASTLISRTVAVAELRTGADFAAVVLCDALGPIDENDPALVTLRARLEPLDLHGIETAMRGEIAYPMVARGQLVGALILGPKHSGEAYAPDESAALAAIAHSVASALDVLQARRAPDSAALEDIRNLCTRMLALLEVRA